MLLFEDTCHILKSEIKKGILTILDAARKSRRNRDSEKSDELDATICDKTIEKKNDMIYSVNDVPPWYMCVLLGFQHYLTMFGGTFAFPLILAPYICAGNNEVAKSELVGTIFFVSGMCTLLQSTVGVRLPIIQGGSGSYLVPALALMQLPKWTCPVYIDGTFNSTFNESDPEIWHSRMREIQGAIISASLFQILIGATGAIGFLLKFIGPLTIAPTITLIGMAMFIVAADWSSKNWPVAIMAVVFIILFSQYIKNITIPCPSISMKNRKCSKSSVPVFNLFAVILGIIITWILCGILTVTNAIPNDPEHWAYGARTDTKSSAISDAKWFRIPYPGQWGTPTFSIAGTFGMLTGVLAGVIESVGDYYACARLSGAPPPPVFAVNRGVLVEGIGCILSGLWGSGNATTSYGENIGVIGITKVGSVRVIQCAGCLMVIFGMFGKFAALFVTIPDPIIGGVFLVMCGMITAVGLSNLQFLNMNSSRSLFVAGFSIFFGLSVSHWMGKNQEVINTGNDIADQIIKVLLSTSMFVGGVTGFFLDNTIPGSPEERGLTEWCTERSTDSPDNLQTLKCYQIPIIENRLRKYECTQYIPFSSSFKGYSLKTQKIITSDV